MMQRKVICWFFFQMHFFCLAMNRTYSVHDLIALADTKSFKNFEKIDEITPGKILKPYLKDEIPDSHWFYEILMLRESALKEMKAVLISHNEIKLSRDGKYIKYPLHEAVRAGLAPVVELLVKLKADVNHPNYHGARPLHYVARIIGGKKVKKKALDIAKYLIAHGADTNALNHVNETALCLAVDANFRKLVKLLNDNGGIVSFVSANIRSINGSPLERAAKSANCKMINLLLKRGAEDIDSAIVVVNRLLDHYNAKQEKFVVDNQKIIDLNHCLELLKERNNNCS